MAAVTNVGDDADSDEDDLVSTAPKILTGGKSLQGKFLETEKAVQVLNDSSVSDTVHQEVQKTTCTSLFKTRTTRKEGPLGKKITILG